MAEPPIPGRHDESDVFVVAHPHSGYGEGTWSTSGVFLDRNAAQAHADAMNGWLRARYPEAPAYTVKTLNDLLSDVYSDGRHDGEHPYEG